MHGHWKCRERLEGLRIFHSKNVGEPIEYSRCLPLPCFNKFVLTQKNFVLFVTKPYQPFCVRTRGDALIKVPCSGLLPSIEVDLCYLRKWGRRIITFYFNTSTVDVGECIQSQQHWPKQHSKVVTPQERLLSIIQFFAKVFRRLYHLPMK